jgi:hypothetical protein
MMLHLQEACAHSGVATHCEVKLGVCFNDASELLVRGALTPSLLETTGSK